MSIKRFVPRDGLDNNNNTLINVADPVNPQDAATKSFASNAGNLTSGTVPAARMPAFTGDATTVAGSTALAFTATGVGAGTYSKVTVDAKGRVTGGAALAAADVPNLDWSKLTSGKPTTLAGYGITDAILSSAKGAANGVATLDGSGKVPAAQLPSYVDDVLDFPSLASFPAPGASGIIYVDTSTDYFYRWSGSSYIRINDAASTSDAATKLATARTIAMTGDVAWSVSFDGSGNVTASATLTNSGVVANTYTKVTVDAKGRVTGGASLVAGDIPNLDWSKLTSGKPTTLAGYGITNAVVAPAHGDIGSATLTTSTTTANQIVDSFVMATYGAAKYTVQIKSGVERHVAELLVTHNGTTASIVEFATVTTAGFLGTFDAVVSGSAVNLVFTPVNAASVVKAMRTLIDA